MAEGNMAPTATESLFERYGPRYRWLAAITVMLGTTSMILASTIVNVAIPDFMHAFGVGQGQAQWLATGFLAAMTATMPMAPWSVGTFGQRRTYIAALGAFIAASLLGGLSTNAELVVGSRILQGAAAGIIQPLAMITLFEVFPSDRRGRAMSVYGLGVILAPALGPALGGLLVEQFGWRGVFFLTLPPCALGLVLAGWFMPWRDASANRRRFDGIGLLLLVLFLMSLLEGLTKSQFGALSAVPLLLLAVALLSGIGFVGWELRHRQPMLELRIFRNSRFAAASVVAFAYGFGIYGSTYLIPLFVQTLAGYDALQAGLLLVPGGVVLGGVIPLAGLLADRGAAHLVVMAGLILFGLSFYGMSYAGAATAFWTLAIVIVVGRIGLGLVIPGLNAGAIQALTLEQVPQGSGAINFVRQLGGAFGVNLLAIFVEWRSHTALTGTLELLDARTEAFQAGFALLGAIFACTLLPAWFMRRR